MCFTLSSVTRLDGKELILFFFFFKLLDSCFKKENRICDKKVLQILSRTAGFICGTVITCLFHTGNKKIKPSTANLTTVSSTDQNGVFKTDSTEGSNIAYLCWQIPYFPAEIDVIFTACHLTASSLCTWNFFQQDALVQESESMTMLLKLLEEKKRPQRRNGLCRDNLCTDVSRCTGSLALLLLAVVPFPHLLRLKPSSLDLLPSS